MQEITDLLKEMIESLRGIQKEIKANTLTRKNVHTSPEAALHTGFSESQLDKLAARREIPFSQPGGKIRFFDRNSTEKYLLSKPVTPFFDIEQEAISFVTDYAREGGRNGSF